MENEKTTPKEKKPLDQSKSKIRREMSIEDMVELDMDLLHKELERLRPIIQGKK